MFFHPQRDGHPKLSGMKLEHEHPIKKEALETTLTRKAPWKAPEFFHEVVRATVDGMHKKRQNSAGRLAHIFWMTSVQSVTEDTTTDAFVWMLEAYRKTMGKAPEVFIQDADQTMTETVQQVHPHAVLKRCVWHLNQSLDKNPGSIVRDGRKELMVMFSAART
ncbi:unnamed protein product [Ascophyllum nodosum]